jgi:hypothetical protein
MMKKGKGHFMYKNNYGCMRDKIMKIVEGRLLKGIDVSAETFNSLIEDVKNDIEKIPKWLVIGTGKDELEGILTNPTDMEITSSGFPDITPTFTGHPYYTDGTGPQTTGGTEWAEESKGGPSKERK